MSEYAGPIIERNIWLHNQYQDSEIAQKILKVLNTKRSSIAREVVGRKASKSNQGLGLGQSLTLVV